MKHLILLAPIFSWSVHSLADVGIKNYRQLYSTMSVVTGVPKNNPATSTYFTTAYRRLSETGAVTSVTAPLLLTTTVLASRFCKEMINIEAGKNSGQRTAHGAVDFAKGPKSFIESSQRDVLTRYAYLFWGMQPTQNELNIGLQVFAESAQGLTDTADNLRKVLLAGCSPALASLNLITH